MKNILITGGAGYIGSELIKTLLTSDDVERVVIYDNLSRDNHNFFLGQRLANGYKLQFVNGELLDSRKLKKALTGIDTVIHLAAKVTTPFADADPHYFEQVNHWGTAELVYAIEESTTVNQLIFASSVSVYGSSSSMIDESRNPNPRTIYGISKMRGEEHVMRLMDKINTQVLRLGNVYGYSPSMRFDAVINRFMFDANFNGRISINGDGKQHRPFISVEKVASVLRQVVEKEVPTGVYNVVDKNLQVLDLVDAMKGLFPEMEFVFINQHLALRELLVNPESKLREYVDFGLNKSLNVELEQFKEQLSF